MQPGMSYFEVQGVGYIAYAKYWGMRFALGEPVPAAFARRDAGHLPRPPSLRGAHKQIIRTAINAARAEGNELRFLIRPMIVDYREGTRYFYAYRDGEAVGFVFFDPLYRDGRLAGCIPSTRA